MADYVYEVRRLRWIITAPLWAVGAVGIAVVMGSLVFGCGTQSGTSAEIAANTPAVTPASIGDTPGPTAGPEPGHTVTSTAYSVACGPDCTTVITYHSDRAENVAWQTPAPTPAVAWAEFTPGVEVTPCGGGA